MSAPTSPSPSEEARFTFWHWFLLAVSVAPMVLYAFSPRAEDLELYYRTARSFLGGAVPNRDFRFEYPPYAMLWFVPAAWLSGNFFEFIPLFGLQLTLFDAATKWMLLSEGTRRWGRSLKAWVPLAVYTVASLVQSIHYLKRYDLIPATFTLAALIALSRRRDVLAGLALSIGIVTKLYPVVLVPLALAVCWKRGAWSATRRLVLGLTLGVLPLVPMSFFWPWWLFASFHVGRGLQVESLGASLLWGAHLLGLAPDVLWVHAPAAYEVQGAAAEAVKNVSRWVWVVGSLASAAVGLWAVYRRAPERVEDLARLALLPLIAFVALNPVLSPQYLVWLTGVAGLVLLSGPRAAPVAVFIAAVLTRGIFAGSSYHTGLGVQHEVLLLVRNFLLLYAGAVLVRDLQRSAAVAEPAPQRL